jgi:hypothetical protein
MCARGGVVRSVGGGSDEEAEVQGERELCMRGWRNVVLGAASGRMCPGEIGWTFAGVVAVGLHQDLNGRSYVLCRRAWISQP